MLWIHPAIQLIATVAGFYAAYLGGERFLSQHVGLRTQFLWKRHVLFGRIAMLLWLGGLLGGLIIARLKWQVNFITGEHYEVAFAMVPLLVVGVVSGIYMDRRKAKRTALPILHGACNLLLLFMAFYQIKTGWQVIQNLVL
ncbi:DUF4079 family protein [uncultured Pseudodesulfovibrio sp.]|uniref:DUF4079 family protein n=1 Tax=uncultured Pseudodesulfovibrio sp. TaxID=2035858 RepID=UPI0029C6F935|nr:DUF4079 family protein [uncultured Pseudodesulfovibrio sp.]